MPCVAQLYRLQWQLPCRLILFAGIWARVKIVAEVDDRSQCICSASASPCPPYQKFVNISTQAHPLISASLSTWACVSSISAKSTHAHPAPHQHYLTFVSASAFVTSQDGTQIAALLFTLAIIMGTGHIPTAPPTSATYSVKAYQNAV